MKNLYYSGGNLRFEIGDEDGIRRLREALGHLLQVNQLCVLLGSGASFHLGSPKIRSVTADEIRAYCTDAGFELSESQTKTLGELVGESTDVEHLLGQLAASLTHTAMYSLDHVDLGGTTASKDDVRALFSAVNVGLAAACVLPRGSDLIPPHDVDPWHSHREFFRRLIGSRRPDAPRVRVFTINYDTVIEESLDDCGIHYFDGFAGGVRRRLNLTAYDNDLFSSPTGTNRGVLRVHDVVHLYKLHGSLNWRVQTPRPGLAAPRVIQSWGRPEPGELAVIYPTPTKETDVLGHPYADLLRIFGTSLNMSECALLIVGYGFRDEHINRLLFEALAHNSTLQVFVAEPFNVVSDDGTDDDPVRLDTPVGRLSEIADARISVLTGDVACFSKFALVLPDVAERSPDQQEELEERLARVLLSAPLPDEADDTKSG